MITLNSNSSKFSISLQADAYNVGEAMAFSLSRTMLRVVRVLTPLQLSVVRIYSGTTGMDVNMHVYTDTDGVLEIPLKNFVNKALGLGLSSFQLQIDMREVNSHAYFDSLVLTVHVCHGVSYYDALAPRNKDAEQLYWSGEHYVILPPNIIINPLHFAGAVGQGVIVESNYASIDTDTVWEPTVGGVFQTAIVPSGERSNQLPLTYATESLRITAGKNHDQIKVWPMTRADECTNLVVCRWTSQTGAVRQHYFPVVSFIEGNDKEVSVISAGDGYDVRKANYNGIKCRLSGLTAYGYWYYMDILRASDLHAIVQPTFSSFADEIANPVTSAYCELGNAETPQGNGFYNFEFTIRLRHYDTV